MKKTKNETNKQRMNQRKNETNKERKNDINK